MLWFIVGLFLGMSFGFLIGIILAHGSSVRDQDDYNYLVRENNNLREEVEFGHRYFDLYRMPRMSEFGTSKLSLSSRIDLMLKNIAAGPGVSKDN